MYVGIDQSLTSTGIVICDVNLNIIDGKMIKTKKERGIKRIHHIVEDIINTIDIASNKLKWGEKLIVVREGSSYGSKSNSSYEIGELGGVVNMMIASIDEIDEYYIIPPTTVKKYVLGNGGIKKKGNPNYLKIVKEKTGKTFESNDIADAFLLIACLEKEGFEKENYNIIIDV